MKPYKILLSLHSIKLIVISALALIFLAITATNSSNKNEAFQEDVSIVNVAPNSFTVVDAFNPLTVSVTGQSVNVDMIAGQ